MNNGQYAGNGSQQAAMLRQRFGLSGNPFADDPEFFFTGGQRQHHLDSLRHLAAFGDLSLLLTGEPGSGRSRMLQQLARSERQRLTLQELPVSVLEKRERLPSVLSRLSGQPLSEYSPQQACTAFFVWTASQSRRWVLLLDDGDKVPTEVLATLLDGRRDPAVDTTRAAVLVIAGRPSLPERISREEGAELLEGVHEIPLRPLDQNDIRHYLQSAFDRVGGDASGAITPQILRRLERYSGGSLGRLRVQAPAVLLGLGEAGEGAEASEPESTPLLKRVRSGSLSSMKFPSLERLRLWAGLALGLLGLSFLLVSLFYDGKDPQPEALTEDVEFSELARVRQAMGDDLVVAEPPVTESPGPLFNPVTVTPPAEDPVPEPEVTPEPVSGTPTEPEPAPAAPGEEESSGFTPGLPDYYRDREWVERREEGYYTIQILGSYQESTAIQFIRNNAVSEMVYVRSRYRGDPWFVVLVGEYRYLEAARQVLNEELPAPLRERNPWIRPMSGL